MPFDLLNPLWSFEPEKFQNVNVHKSLPDAPTNRAFNIPMGNSGKLYRESIAYPDTHPKNAIYRQQPLFNKTLDPTAQNENNINKQGIARVDPRTNITGKDVNFARRIANMDIQRNSVPIYPLIAMMGIFIGALILVRKVK